MPKVYWKTIIASVLLGLDIAGMLAGVVPPRLGTWTLINLLAFILINEKLTRGERWGWRHVLLYLAVLTLSTILIFGF